MESLVALRLASATGSSSMSPSVPTAGVIAGLLGRTLQLVGIEAVSAAPGPAAAREALMAPAGREAHGDHGGGDDDHGGQGQPRQRTHAREDVADRPEEPEDRVDE